MNNRLTPTILVSWIYCSIVTVSPSFAQSYDLGNFPVQPPYQGQSAGQGNVTSPYGSQYPGNTNPAPYANLPVNQNPSSYVQNVPRTPTYITPSPYANLPAQYMHPQLLTNPIGNPNPLMSGPVAPLVPRLPGVPLDKKSGLPPTTLDSFVKEAGGRAEAIYGDEGTGINGPPPMSNFTKGDRINRGIVGVNNKGLTTGHGSWLPDAWGGDGTRGQPNEWSMSGPREPKAKKVRRR